ncbi:MAG: IS1 family transposase [Phycisphaerae bacterium]|jgi:IS1 family transposase
MNQLSTERRKAIVAALVEGNSIRATCRMTGVAKNTVVKLLCDLGAACSVYMDAHMRNLSCRTLQVDEIWSFVYAKQKNVPIEKALEGGVGDVWTWVAIDAETKLVPSYVVGDRGSRTARQFMHDLASRLAHRVQLTSDGHNAYLNAVDSAFGDDIDYAMLQKLYGEDGNPKRPETKYSPGKVNGTRRRKVTGDPNPKLVSTSYAERQNLTMRMSMRRFTRLTKAFSKKITNLAHAVSLHFMHYNYCRKHQSLKMTPAQAAGISDHTWTIEELLSLLDSN